MERARILLACLEGKEIQQVAREVGASMPTVSKWRRRFSKEGVQGLHDRPRSGKPAIYDAAFRGRVLALLEQAPSAGVGHWDGRAVAETLGLKVQELYTRQQKLSGSSVVGIDDAGPDFLDRTRDENQPDPFEMTAHRETLARLVAGIDDLPEKM